MFKRIIKNDIRNSKLISTSTLLIITAASALVSLSIILAINLFGAIDNLMDSARTPHFMQMHSGDINIDRLDKFAKSNNLIEDYQILDFLNIDGPKIIINGTSLADSIQDNGFSTQSENFDYLLDLNGNPIEAHDGEIYLPTYLMKDNMAQVGDTAIISGKTFYIAGFIRDSQMNSSLASSKRYLVSINDYREIKDSGSLEYLIEFRLNNLSDINSFESQYTSAGLETNGPIITFPLFRMLNAISGGIMIAIILLVSLLILAIALMCIRFTLLAKIEDDYREIGVMKAIGLDLKDIKNIYLAKYGIIAGTGCLLGLITSFLLKNILLNNIRLYMGESKNTVIAPIVSLAGGLLIFIIIILYINRVLKKFKKISPVEALRSNTSSDKTSKSKYLKIDLSRFLGPNVFLGIKDVLSRKGIYLTMLIILIISTFIMIVPQNIYTTISSRNFITYMGIGDIDIRIDLQQTDNIPNKAKEISNSMKQDKNIQTYSILYTKFFVAKSAEGTDTNLRVELGDHTIFPVRYFKGKAPVTSEEIALSSTNAEELNKKVGDILTLKVDGKDKLLTVCGIYSDITNGGKTAKATFSTHLDDVMWCVISAKTTSSDVINGVLNRYSKDFSYSKVSDIEEYIHQTFGATMDSIKMASIASIIVSIIISSLIIALFMKMLISKDKYSISVMRSLGFTKNDITIQYIARAIFVVLIGIILGTILANTLGESLAGLIISSLGANSFKFIINPITSYVLCPIILICTVVITSIVGTSKGGKIKISDNIKE